MTTKAEQKLPAPGSYPLKVTHIGVITRDIEKTVKQYEALGVGPFVRFSLPSPEFITEEGRRWNYDISVDDLVYDIAYGKMSNGFGVEIFQIKHCPNPEKTIAMQYLKAKGECVWHLGHDVDDMDETIEWMKNAGYAVIGGGDEGGTKGTRMRYFDTTEDFGYVIQAHEVRKGSLTESLTKSQKK